MQNFWIWIMCFAGKRLFRYVDIYAPDGADADLQTGGIVFSNDLWYTNEVHKIGNNRDEQIRQIR